MRPSYKGKLPKHRTKNGRRRQNTFLRQKTRFEQKRKKKKQSFGRKKNKEKGKSIRDRHQLAEILEKKEGGVMILAKTLHFHPSGDRH